MRIFTTRVGLIRVYEDVHISIGRVVWGLEWTVSCLQGCGQELSSDQTLRLLSQIGAKNYLPHREPTKVSWNVTKVLLPLLLHSWGNMFGDLHLWPAQNQHITRSALSFRGSFPKQMVHDAEMTSTTISDYQMLPGCLWLSVVPWQDIGRHTLRLGHFTLLSFWSSQVGLGIRSRICMPRKSHCKVNFIHMCI